MKIVKNHSEKLTNFNKFFTQKQKFSPRRENKSKILFHSKNHVYVFASVYLFPLQFAFFRLFLQTTSALIIFLYIFSFLSLLLYVTLSYFFFLVLPVCKLFISLLVHYYSLSLCLCFLFISVKYYESSTQEDFQVTNSDLGI